MTDEIDRLSRRLFDDTTKTIHSSIRAGNWAQAVLVVAALGNLIPMILAPELFWQIAHAAIAITTAVLFAHAAAQNRAMRALLRTLRR
jgi:hypothetical protein